MSRLLKLLLGLCTVSLFLSVIFKIQHWYGGNIMFYSSIIGGVIVALLIEYTHKPPPIQLDIKSDSNPIRGVILKALLILSSLTLLMGILFKIMYWPDSSFMLVSGSLGLLITIVVWLLTKEMSRKNLE